MPFGLWAQMGDHGPKESKASSKTLIISAITVSEFVALFLTWNTKNNFQVTHGTFEMFCWSLETYNKIFCRCNMSEIITGKFKRITCNVIMTCSTHRYWFTRLLLWSPYGIGQTIVFSCCSFFFPPFFFSWPNVSRRRLYVCHTSTHGVALVRI